MKYITRIMDKQNLMKEEDFKEYIISEAKKMEEEYHNVLEFSLKKYDRFSRYLEKNRVNSSKKKLGLIQKEVDKIYDLDGSKYDNYIFILSKIDHKYNTNFYEMSRNIKWEEDINKKYKLLKKLYEDFREFFIYIAENKKENKKSKKVIYDFLVFIKEKKKITKSEIDKNKKEQKRLNAPVEKKKYLDDDPKMDYLFLNEYSINTKELDEVLISYRHLIRSEDITSDLVSFLLMIIKRLVDEEHSEKNIDILHSILDSIKYRKQLLINDEYLERKILNICYSSLKEYVELEKLSIPEEEPHDYKFDIIMELLKDEKNYPILKKTVKKYPQIVNIRNNKKSILVYILLLYMNNYKMIIEDHKYDYNIDYLKEVYRLFSNSNSLYLSFEDKQEIDLIINNFIEEVSDLDIGSKKQNYAINDITDLKLDNVIKEKKYLKKVDKFMFDANMRDIEFLDFNHSKRPSELDLTDEHTFMLNNPYTCYSFVEEKGHKSLKIHTADLSNMVEEGSALDNYIYNCKINNKNIKQGILSKLSFKEGEIVSALTHEIVFDNDRKIKGYKTYRSRIRVDGDILSYQDNEYVYKNLRRITTEYIQKYGDVNLSGLAKIEYILNSILQKEFVKMTRNNKLPIIAYKKEEKEGLDQNTFSYIKNKFSKLDKSDYKRLSKIFDSNIEEEYYDNQVRIHGEYDLGLTGNPDYIYLLNQRMIKELVNNELGFIPNYYSIYKENTKDRYTNLKDILNDILDYKNDIDFDYKKRRNYKTFVLKKEE